MHLIRENGFDFSFDPKACENCHRNCCIGESGYIWVTEEEIHKISNFLGLGINDFISHYLVQIGNRFSLKECKINGSFECVFFDDQNRRCSIYSVRPTQCRRFPFWDHFKSNVDEAIKECPGVTIVLHLTGQPSGSRT
ncbi:MAG: YkgJ family cysteine cluster protein [Deltaproteobacteria bacterium]|nr:MAG: YkgJ family cysteine cluster protein [Deltaproteobacteria bacterium]